MRPLPGILLALVLLPLIGFILLTHTVFIRVPLHLVDSGDYQTIRVLEEKVAFKPNYPLTWSGAIYALMLGVVLMAIDKIKISKKLRPRRSLRSS